MRCFAFLVGLTLSSVLAAPAAARPLVAVIDTGVARTAELAPVLIAEYDMAAEPARPAFRPSHDHGTLVSTVLHREAKGQVDIISLRIDEPAGCAVLAPPPCQSQAAPIARAIYKAMELGVDAINMSLSLKDDPMIDKAIYYASRQGIQVILSAGNKGRDKPGNLKMALAGHPNTVLVGAVDASGMPWSGTNRPEAKEKLPYNYVWQLGVDVPTACADGRPMKATGTSLAAPTETARRMTQASVTWRGWVVSPRLGHDHGRMLRLSKRPNRTLVHLRSWNERPAPSARTYIAITRLPWAQAALR